MLDVHPPHHSAHSWRDFFVHIATIVIGLLIAIGLEQSVEAIHHHHQVRELRSQLREVFEHNLRSEPAAMKNFAEFRAYHVEMLAAVNARLAGHPLANEPVRDDPRMRNVSGTPSLAPYEVAKQNGTLDLLPSDEIRMYNRVGLQREFMLSAIANWFDAILAMETFEEQFRDSTGNLEVGGIVPTPDLSKLTPEELREYRIRIAAVIKTTDRVTRRITFFDSMSKIILDGAHDETSLIAAIFQQLGANEPEPKNATGGQ